MNAEDHFKALLTKLPDATRRLYDSCTNIRVEQAFIKRHFIVYQMATRLPEILDRIIVNDFECNGADGASCEITSVELKSSMIVTYAPQQLFNYPVFVWLPLQAKLRWSAPPSAPAQGSLAFPMTIRTQSRLHLRERGVTYCETGPTYGQEFDGQRG